MFERSISRTPPTQTLIITNSIVEVQVYIAELLFTLKTRPRLSVLLEKVRGLDGGAIVLHLFSSYTGGTYALDSASGYGWPYAAEGT